MKGGFASLPFNGNLQQVTWDLSKRAPILCCTGVLDSFPLDIRSYLICIANELDFSLSVPMPGHRQPTGLFHLQRIGAVVNCPCSLLCVGK